MSDTTRPPMTAVPDLSEAKSHVSGKGRDFRVAPTPEDHDNVTKEVLKPLACWLMGDFRFHFGSSLVRWDALDDFQALDRLRHRHPGTRLCLFGHADPIGNDSNNKVLSGRRAQSVYAVLTRQTDLWEDLYSSPAGSDQWTEGDLANMLLFIGYIDTVDGSPVDEAILRRFQDDFGVPQSGQFDKETRRVLFRAYMDLICVDAPPGDVTPMPYELDPANHFLGGGENSEGIGDYQGCSEFNPRMIFSAREWNTLQAWSKQDERNWENAPNRRVMGFLFPLGSKLPGNWPCPAATAGHTQCMKTFFHDGERRRSYRYNDRRRDYAEDGNTFACMHYDRLAQDSPCYENQKPMPPPPPPPDETQEDTIVRAHVTRSSDGAYLEGADVYLYEAGQPVAAASAQTYSMGVAYFDGVRAPETYTLRVYRDGYASQQSTIEVDPGKVHEQRFSMIRQGVDEADWPVEERTEEVVVEEWHDVKMYGGGTAVPGCQGTPVPGIYILETDWAEAALRVVRGRTQAISGKESEIRARHGSNLVKIWRGKTQGSYEWTGDMNTTQEGSLDNPIPPAQYVWKKYHFVARTTIHYQVRTPPE